MGLPPFLTRAALAEALMISETQVSELVRRGVLPQPIKLGGCVRWRWASVEQALASLEPGGNDGPAEDPFLAGVRRATAEAPKDRGRGRAA